MTGLTTTALLAAESRRTGFTQVQLLQIVAKSALIRHLAGEPEGENFICKGGTALHHVYGSARFSIVDADFMHREPKTVQEATLNTALTVDDAEFAIDFTSVRWDTANDVWSAKHVGYKIDGVPVNAPGVDMSVSVSVQRGEWLAERSRACAMSRQSCPSSSRSGCRSSDVRGPIVTAVPRETTTGCLASVLIELVDQLSDFLATALILVVTAFSRRRAGRARPRTAGVNAAVWTERTPLDPTR